MAEHAPEQTSRKASQKTNWHAFANPARFQRFSDRILPWVAGATIISFVIGIYYALFNSPPDYQQGETVRIMYVHVPSAWMALFAYGALALSCAFALVWKHPLAEVAAQSIAPIGAVFTATALMTGSLWGKPMWGTWWVWDARLTSFLLLLFLYLGYMALQNAFDDPVRGAKASAILALVGVVNLPIIKYSVDWWNTLHQGTSVARMDGPTIDINMLIPLLIMALAFKLLFTWFVLLGIRSELIARRIRVLRMRQIDALHADS